MTLPGARDGVSDGTRTRDIRDHNQVLYQLSYTHHDSRIAVAAREHGKDTCSQGVPGAGSGDSGASPVSEPPWRVASSRASAEPGPGAGTNTAAR